MMSEDVQTEAPVDLRCSPVAQALDRTAIGTAPSMTAVLLIELPQPWPSSIEDHPLLAPLLPLADELDLSIKGLVPYAAEGDGAADRPRGATSAGAAGPNDAAGPNGATSNDAGASGGFTRLVLHRREPGAFTEFGRAEAIASFDELVPTVRDLWERTTPTNRVDVLVCAHGRRDRCCGSFGTRCAVAATRRGVLVQRASHLGGHRFAPTGLLLPQGTAWAWLDDDLLAAIVERRIEPAELRRHYRGSVAASHPAEQLLEAEAFFDTGWSWLDRPRSFGIEPDGADRWKVEVLSGDDRWFGVVERTGTVPQPLCGEPLENAKKVDGVYELRVAERPDL